MIVVRNNANVLGSREKSTGDCEVAKLVLYCTESRSDSYRGNDAGHGEGPARAISDKLVPCIM